MRNKTEKTGRTPLHQWQIKANDGSHVCRACGEKRHLTVEHIIPQSIIKHFCLQHYGDSKIIDAHIYYWEDNFEYLCLYCNRKKGGEIDPRHPKTYRLMRQLLDDAEKYHLRVMHTPTD